MKMKFFHRVSLALYSLIWLIVLVAIALNNSGLLQIGWYVNDMVQSVPVLPYIALIVMALWSFRLFLLSFKREKQKQLKDKNSVSVQNAEQGAVNVSVAALETLIKEAIGQRDDVLETKSQVVNHEDSITIMVRMVLTPAAHIPNVTMIMQRNIKRYIEEFSGIAVREVVITVAEVRAPQTGRRARKAEKAPEAIMAPAIPLEEKPEQNTETPTAQEAPATVVDETVTVQQTPVVIEAQPAAEVCDEAAPQSAAQPQEDLPFGCFVKENDGKESA